MRLHLSTIAAIGLASLMATLGGCATTSTRPKLEDKWEVTRPAAITQAPPAALQPVIWKGIQPGKTKRSEVESRFGAGTPSGGWFHYRIDAIATQIAYSPDGTVRAIRLPSAVSLDRDTLVAQYDKANRERKSDSLVIWDYESAGISVDFAPGQQQVSSVEVDTRPAPQDALSTGLGKELVPVRPPLTDLPARRHDIREAMGLTSDTAYSLVTSEQEKAHAQEYYDDLASRSLIMTDNDLQAYLDGLIARLASVTPANASEWKIAALKMELPNAANLGGGTILVTRGLFKEFSSEGQLAYVVSHEMAHQLKHHVAAATARAQTAAVLILAAAIAASAATGSSAAGQAVQAAGGGAASATLSHFSREEETEADALALRIIEAAGYDPRGEVNALQVLDKLSKEEGAQNSLLFATHPEAQTRLNEVRQQLAAQPNRDYSATLVTTQEFIEIRERCRPDAWR